MEKTIRPIARIRTGFPEKFGVPRQSGLIEELRGRIIFEKPYRRSEALRGIEDYSHLWLIFGFSLNPDCPRSLTVSPPHLNGEKRGVFATRSPFRPNGLGLSCVKLIGIDRNSPDGPCLIVGGCDMVDNTPIYDVKPYLPYADSIPDASGSFGQAHRLDRIAVDFPEELRALLPEELRMAAVRILEADPRAAYEKKEGQVLGLSFSGYDIRFRTEKDRLVVFDVVRSGGADFRKIK